MIFYLLFLNATAFCLLIVAYNIILQFVGQNYVMKKALVNCDYFFDMKEIRLNCSGCKSDLETVTEGTIINKFYFFKWNIDGADVIVEDIILEE